MGQHWVCCGEYESPQKIAEQKEKKGIVMKADLRPLLENSNEAKEDLRVSDYSIGGFEVHTQKRDTTARSPNSVSASPAAAYETPRVQSDPQRREARTRVRCDAAAPPHEKDRDVAYTEAVGKIKKHKEYFIKKALKDERTARLAYKFRGLHPTISWLSLSWQERWDARFAPLKTDPKAGASMHSKIGWKSNLARNDQLAVSDPNALAKSEAVEKLFKDQGVRTEKQRKDMEFRNDRYEHLLQVIRWEMKEEHNREAKELEQKAKGVKEGKAAQMEVWLERLNSIDEIMMLLKEYGIVGALDEADLLIYQVDKWAEEMKKHVPANQSRRGKKRTSGANDDDDDGHSVEAIFEGAKGSGRGEGHHSNAFTSIADAVRAPSREGEVGGAAPGTADTTTTASAARAAGVRRRRGRRAARWM